MLWWLVQNTVVAAVLAGFVALACGVARPRPAVRHALWLVVLLKLMAPPLISWPWTAWDVAQPVLQWLAPDRTPIEQNDPPDEPAFPARLDAQLPPAETEVVFIPVIPEEESPSTTVELPPTNSSIQNPDPENPEGDMERLPDVPDTASVSIINLMTNLWLMGALAVGFWQAWRIGRFHRRLTKALPVPNWLTSEVAELAALLHIRTPQIAVLQGSASPLVCFNRSG